MSIYIQRLKAENEALRAELATTREIVTDLRVYLNSSKFHEDTTVQVRDVLNRLQGI